MKYLVLQYVNWEGWWFYLFDTEEEVQEWKAQNKYDALRVFEITSELANNRYGFWRSGNDR